MFSKNRPLPFFGKCVFLQAESPKGEKAMAKPIEATPMLEGSDALAFFAEMEKNEKASEEERKRIKADADIIRSMLTFAF